MSWKTPITLLVLLVVLLGAAFYGWKTIISPSGDDDEVVAKQPRCDQTQDFTRGQVIKAGDIVVNVYNSGSIANLAGETLESLDRKGFEPGVSDNAPTGFDAANVTIVTAAKDSPPVKLVAEQFKGTVKYVKGRDLAPGIDVIVGDNFIGTKPGAKKSLRVTRDVTTCTDVQSAPS